MLTANQAAACSTVRRLAAALAARAEVAAQQPLGIRAEGALGTALAALALDAARVATLTGDLGDQLAVTGLERARIERLTHRGTISLRTRYRQGARAALREMNSRFQVLDRPAEAAEARYRPGAHEPGPPLVADQPAGPR